MRMHIGFSFKPKTILIIIGVVVALLAACVDAFADDATPTDATPTNVGGSTVIVQTVPVSSPAVDTYSYSRDAHTGLAAAIDNIFGSYMPLMQTDSAGNISVVSGIAGVDFAWVGGCFAFLILFYSFFRLLGGVFIGKSR